MNTKAPKVTCSLVLVFCQNDDDADWIYIIALHGWQKSTFSEICYVKIKDKKRICQRRIILLYIKNVSSGCIYTPFIIQESTV